MISDSAIELLDEVRNDLLVAAGIARASQSAAAQAFGERLIERAFALVAICAGNRIEDESTGAGPAHGGAIGTSSHPAEALDAGADVPRAERAGPARASDLDAGTETQRTAEPATEPAAEPGAEARGPVAAMVERLLMKLPCVGHYIEPTHWSGLRTADDVKRARAAAAADPRLEYMPGRGKRAAKIVRIRAEPDDEPMRLPATADDAARQWIAERVPKPGDRARIAERFSQGSAEWHAVRRIASGDRTLTIEGGTGKRPVEIVRLNDDGSHPLPPRGGATPGPPGGKAKRSGITAAQRSRSHPSTEAKRDALQWLLSRLPTRGERCSLIEYAAEHSENYRAACVAQLADRRFSAWEDANGVKQVERIED